MFPKAFSFGGLLALAVATVLLTAEPSQAAPPDGRYYSGYYQRNYGGSLYYRPYYGGYSRPYYSGFYRPYYGDYRPYYRYYGSPYYYGPYRSYSSYPSYYLWR